ncbi:MAG: hypothetical protein ACE14S_04170 [Candidatus Bathyarchaeia archaeon]
MEKPSSPWKTRGFKTAVALIVVVVIVAAAVAFLPAQPPPRPVFTDPQNDAMRNLGSDYAAVIDITSVSLERTGNTLTLAIYGRQDSFAPSSDEFARWNMLLVLEKGNSIVKTYEIAAEVNSTGTHGYVLNLEDESTRDCEVKLVRNQLTVSMTLDGLQDADRADWSISSTYEKLVDGSLVASANDFAPDAGTSATSFKP